MKNNETKPRASVKAQAMFAVYDRDHNVVADNLTFAEAKAQAEPVIHTVGRMGGDFKKRSARKSYKDIRKFAIDNNQRMFGCFDTEDEAKAELARMIADGEITGKDVDYSYVKPFVPQRTKAKKEVELSPETQERYSSIDAIVAEVDGLVHQVGSWKWAASPVQRPDLEEQGFKLNKRSTDTLFVYFNK
jgi:hypothetical protein